MMDLGNVGKPIKVTKDNISDFLINSARLLDGGRFSSEKIIKLTALKHEQLRSKYKHTRPIRKKLEKFVKEIAE